MWQPNCLTPKRLRVSRITKEVLTNKDLLHNLRYVIYGSNKELAQITELRKHYPQVSLVILQSVVKEVRTKW